jgi:hypothetical protein
MTVYQNLIKCKNLGIMVDAEAFDMDVLDDLHTIYVSVEDIQERLRKAKHGQ